MWGVLWECGASYGIEKYKDVPFAGMVLLCFAGGGKCSCPQL